MAAQPQPGTDQILLSDQKMLTQTDKLLDVQRFDSPSKQGAGSGSGGLPDSENNLISNNFNSYSVKDRIVAEKEKEAYDTSPKKQPQDTKIKVEQPESEQLLKQEDIDNFDLNSVRITKKSTIFWIHFWSLIIKRFNSMKRDKRSLICEIIAPGIITAIGLAIILKDYIQDLSPRLLTPDSYSGRPLPLIYSGDLGAASQSDQQSIMDLLEPKQWVTEFYNAPSIDMWDDYNFQKTSISRKGAYYFNLIDNGNLQFNYLAEVSTINRDAAPILMNSMNEAIMRKVLSKPTANIDVTLHPFPNTRGREKLSDTISGFVTAFVFSLSISFIPASIITFIVKEREDQVKHQQMVSGVSIYSYWISNFVFDFLKYLIPATICILMIFIFGVDALQGSDVFPYIVLQFLLFGLCDMSFTYLLGFLFKNYGSAQVAGFFFHFIVGSIFPLVIYILRLFPDTNKIGKGIAWGLRVLPSFSYSYGLMNIGNRELYSQLQGQKTAMPCYDMSIAGGDMIFLAVFSVVYFVLLFVVERMILKGQFSKLFTKELSVPYKEQQYDLDVQKENERVEKSSAKDYTVKVDKLRKVYILENQRFNVAVDRVSFGVVNGECFTLLGVNGAGKTTTFKMLSGEILPTSGEAYISGYSVSTQLAEARKNIGYCPQFDALLEFLTPKEHLELYAAIKGIPKQLIQQLVCQKLAEMDLVNYQNVCSGTLSGGNKRKLSVAIAMLGNPPIVFLDEPSTGMDPKARRFMWTVISRISTKRKQSSIILTTHSMEEAEALSTKIAIMVEGKIKCLGSIQHIKSKFGTGYEVEIKTKLPTQSQMAQLHEIVQHNEQTVTRSQLELILKKLQKEELLQEITERGQASQLFIELEMEKSIKYAHL